jgi:hypothetical protein
VTFLPNVRYLTGYTGSNGTLVLTASGEATFFTDPRYRLQAAQETDCRVKVGTGPLLAHALPILRKKKSRRVAFERSRMSFEMYQSLKEGLPLKSSAEPVGGWIEHQRMIKSEAEIALIRHSVLVNSRAFERAVSGVRGGMSEKDLAAELDYQMRRLGAESAAFETIVATGPRTALPHAKPTAAVFRAGSLILVDMGATCDGYASDMTRMLCLGRPGSRMKRAYAAVLEAQLAGIAAVKAGVEAQTVDRAARRVLRRQHGQRRGLQLCRAQAGGAGGKMTMRRPNMASAAQRCVWHGSGAALLGLMLWLLAGTAAAATYAYRNDVFSYDTPSPTAKTVGWHASGAAPACTGFQDGDDDWADLVFAGATTPANNFTFTFAGSVYSQVRIYSNGILAFGADNSGYWRQYTNLTLPINAASGQTVAGCNNAVPSNLIIAYWTDIVAGTANNTTGAAVQYELLGTAPNRRLVISWANVKLFNQTARYNFQIALYESPAGGLNSNFKYQYTTGSSTGSAATVGASVGPAGGNIPSAPLRPSGVGGAARAAAHLVGSARGCR